MLSVDPETPTPEDLIENERRFVAEVGPRLKALEERYGVPSAEVRQAVQDGRLEDTYETCSWVILWESYRALTQAEPSRLE
ncbi:MAG TPA: hypothetical protein VNO86_05030 [Candidatus Binatia bacterium]|nr:hypothetical protein [Candidatus Binatia bacterium]